MTDEEVVRWYECERRPLLDAPRSRTLTADHPIYRCPWADHWHVGRLSRRRGPGRRVANAWYHWHREQAVKVDNA